MRRAGVGERALDRRLLPRSEEASTLAVDEHNRAAADRLVLLDLHGVRRRVSTMKPVGAVCMRSSIDSVSTATVAMPSRRLSVPLIPAGSWSRCRPTESSRFLDIGITAGH